MQKLLGGWWKKMTTKPCAGCGELVSVTAYRKTGATRKVSVFFAYYVELECPNCGDTFWARK